MPGYQRKLVVPADKWGTVEFAIRATGSSPAEDFLREMGEHAAVFLALFRETAKQGHPNCRKRLTQERGKIYGFKATISNRLYRFGCFQKTNRWILTHGFIKPGAQKGRGRWPPKEITRAETIMEEHLAIESGNQRRNGRGK